MSTVLWFSASEPEYKIDPGKVAKSKNTVYVVLVIPWYCIIDFIDTYRVHTIAYFKSHHVCTDLCEESYPSWKTG